LRLRFLSSERPYAIIDILWVAGPLSFHTRVRRADSDPAL
jgi:hypothetical protein